MRNIDLIREVTTSAAGNWPFIMAGLSVSVPQSPRQHSPCPVCGGKDRFRFDDNGRGSFICNQCGAGDGLDLIRKVHQCDTTQSWWLMCWVLITGHPNQTTKQPTRDVTNWHSSGRNRNRNISNGRPNLTQNAGQLSVQSVSGCQGWRLRESLNT